MTGAGELRQNVVTGTWAVVAPGRGERPVEEDGDQDAAALRTEGRPSHVRDCPFCPGNEHELDGVVLEAPGRDGEPWGVRVLRNRYPAFADGDGVEGATSLLPDAMEVPVVAGAAARASGRQEVIVESPFHDRDPATMSMEELARLTHVWRDRYAALRAEHGGPVVLFRNHGAPAGASLAHPHTQLVAMETVPPRFNAMARRAADWYARHGTCLLCRLPELEPAWEERIVHDGGDVVAFTPWAPEGPLEVWLVPRRHVPELGDASTGDLAGLARSLGAVLGALRTRAGHPSYNLVVHSPVTDSGTPAERHWFARILPRRARDAGFELATGVHIVSSSPEDDAALLRGERGARKATA